MRRQSSCRAAGPDDAAAVADVWLRSFDAALPTVQRAHSDDVVRDFFRYVVVPGHERHGFRAAERTDGSRNEEREPDVRYVWVPAPGS